MEDDTMESYKEKKQNGCVFQPEVYKRISEMSNLNKKSILAGRGAFDKVFGQSTHSRGDSHKNPTKKPLVFSFIQSGHEADDITVLDQHSVTLKIKTKPANNSMKYKPQSLSFECPECGFKCWWDYIMVRHVRKTHTVDGKLYVCIYCKFFCVDEDFYHSHVFNKHSKILGMLTSASFDLALGEKGVLKKYFDERRVKNRFRCPYCDFRTQNQNLFYRHLRKHKTETAFLCSYCEYRSKYKSTLKRHELIHTGERPFSCKICEYRTKSSFNLKNHERIHTGEMPFLCKCCKFRSRTRTNLTRHEKTHTDEKGEKPFSCKCCKFRSKTRANLKRHEMTHTDKKPFKCTYCKFRCNRKDTLKTHEMSHTGEKPYKCTICEYRCTLKSKLNVHTRKLHKSTC